jgi:hypothetical protein
MTTRGRKTLSDSLLLLEPPFVLSADITVQEVDDFLPHSGRRLAALDHRVRRTSLQVVGEQQFLGASQGRVHRGELLKDIGTVALVLDHALDALDLPASAGEALEDVALGGLGDTPGVRRIRSVLIHGASLFYTLV